MKNKTKHDRFNLGICRGSVPCCPTDTEIHGLDHRASKHDQNQSCLEPFWGPQKSPQANLLSLSGGLRKPPWQHRNKIPVMSGKSLTVLSCRFRTQLVKIALSLLNPWVQNLPQGLWTTGWKTHGAVWYLFHLWWKSNPDLLQGTVCRTRKLNASESQPHGEIPVPFTD